MHRYDLMLVYGFLRKIGVIGTLGTIASASIAGSGVILSTFLLSQALPGLILATEALTVFFTGVFFTAVLGMRYVRILVAVKKDVGQK